MRLYLSPTRYYSVAIQLDLFGDPVIVRAWGGRGNLLCGTATEPFSRKRLREIAQERRRRDYSLAGHA